MSIKEELKGKRLLVLGGSLWKDAIQDFTKENEITVIATGNDHSAGIFEIADECYDVDSTDSENMKKLIVDKHIDGVYMGGSEAVISVASKYINELGLPCYCTNEQWNYVQNKVNFKNLCIKFDLPVAPRYDISENDINDNLDIDFPVVTKPVDGCGSNGFSVCNNILELKKGFIHAKDCSPTGSVIVEKFLPHDSIGVIYSFSDGKMCFCTIADRYSIRYPNHGSYVAGLFTYQSNCVNEFRNLFDKKLKKMFNSLGIKEGIIWLEVFHCNDSYYFNEVGYRYGGNGTPYPVNYYTNINQIASDIYFALTGKSNLYGFNSLIKNGISNNLNYGIYCIHLMPGKIKKIEGIDDLNNQTNVIKCLITKSKGAVVDDTGTFNQIFALVHFVYSSREDLIRTIDSIHNTIKVFDENGNNMVNRMLDLSCID